VRSAYLVLLIHVAVHRRLPTATVLHRGQCHISRSVADIL
jgi:hypothetical protein